MGGDEAGEESGELGVSTRYRGTGDWGIWQQPAPALLWEPSLRGWSVDWGIWQWQPTPREPPPGGWSIDWGISSSPQPQHGSRPSEGGVVTGASSSSCQTLRSRSTQTSTGAIFEEDEDDEGGGGVVAWDEEAVQRHRRPNPSVLAASREADVWKKRATLCMVLLRQCQRIATCPYKIRWTSGTI